MDEDVEYSDFDSDESYDIEYNASEPTLPSFEILTANDIVQLMNQYIEYVNAVIQVWIELQLYSAIAWNII